MQDVERRQRVLRHHAGIVVHAGLPRLRQVEREEGQVRQHRQPAEQRQRPPAAGDAAPKPRPTLPPGQQHPGRQQRRGEEHGVPGHVEAGEQHHRVPQHRARAPGQQRPAAPRQQRAARAMRQHAQHRHEGDAEELRVARADVEVVAQREDRGAEQRPAEGDAEHAPRQQVETEEADGAQPRIGELAGQEGIGAGGPRRGDEQAEGEVAVIVPERRRHRVEVEGAVPGDRLAAQQLRPVLHDGEGDDRVVAVADQQGEAVGELAAEEDGEAGEAGQRAEQAAGDGGSGHAPLMPANCGESRGRLRPARPPPPSCAAGPRC